MPSKTLGIDHLPPSLPTWTPPLPAGPYPHYLTEKIPKTTSLNVRKVIHYYIRAIGKVKLGFTEDYTGTHSNHTSSAMALYLANVPVFIILLILHWSSDEFIICIQRKTNSFTQRINPQMIETDIWVNIANSNTQSLSSEDPIIPNSCHLFLETIRFITLVSFQVSPPILNLHH